MAAPATQAITKGCHSRDSRSNSSITPAMTGMNSSIMFCSSTPAAFSSDSGRRPCSSSAASSSSVPTSAPGSGSPVSWTMASPSNWKANKAVMAYNMKT